MESEIISYNMIVSIGYNMIEECWSYRILQLILLEMPHNPYMECHEAQI